MKAQRILLVGNFGRKGLYSNYYNVDHKLANGFIRCGHSVLCFSDRDHAREATPFNSQSFGRKAMAAKLLQTAKNYQPHMALFGHCDLLDDSFFHRLKEQHPAIRLATFCVDAVFRKKTMASFKARAAHCHAAFITTADKKQLATIGIPMDKLHFMPNPVDPSIETKRIFEQPLTSFRLDGQFLGTGIGKREEQLQYIQDALPSNYRFACAGRAFGSKRIEGTEFLQRLCEAPVSLNLPLDDTDPLMMPYLYASDRIAQLLGQGITTISPKASGLSDLYEDGILEYSGREEVIDLMLRLHSDDALRRRIGALGWKHAHDRTSCACVSAKLISHVF
ncbi:glycosyltransferase [Polycladidibacter hongkongensis]|uniref:glycosyltransferase family protein n=1 Tax=Polycladidibacter hongkongensis TaxID=1647556 RepID=UPI000834F907|nr:glycosyltransferase [Pseudovibrio hongkongensis]